MLSKTHKGKIISKETRRKMGISQIGRKHSEETKRKMSMLAKRKIISKESKKKMSLNSKLSIEIIFKRYQFFSIIEEMRYNPNKVNDREIQVHCKNHTCKNSKEHDGWFTPTYSQIGERIRCLERGDDLSYFYCCQECKDICPLYGLSNDPFKNKTKNMYTPNEYQIFRSFVLERDNHICQFCGDKAIDVHHERPKKLEPLFVLDPDYAWSCCKKCHYEKGHKDECSTGNLSTIECK
jgi:hypothetical protein